MTVGRITHSASSAARVATGRVSPNALKIAAISSSNAKRPLFGSPDPAETKRYCDENSRNEQQRCIDRYGYDPIACRPVNASPLSSSVTSSSIGKMSSSSSGGGGGGSSAGATAAAAASQMRHHQFHHHHHHRQQ